MSSPDEAAGGGSKGVHARGAPALLRAASIRARAGSPVRGRCTDGGSVLGWIEANRLKGVS